MQLGMVGLGRMGNYMVQRLMRGGHECVVYDARPESVAELAGLGATGSASLAEFVSKLAHPRAIWLMVPAAIVDKVLASLVPLLEPGDIVIDGGNSYYHDDIRRGADLVTKRHPLRRCRHQRRRLGPRARLLPDDRRREGHRRAPRPDLRTLWRPASARPRTPDARAGASTAEQGYLHCGPHGAGHFVKMVHNGIEYGLMAAYAEGINILQHANVGKQPRTADAETDAARAIPEHYQYDFNLPRRRRGLAPRQRDRLVAARSDRRCAARGPRH